MSSHRYRNITAPLHEWIASCNSITTNLASRRTPITSAEITTTPNPRAHRWPVNARSCNLPTTGTNMANHHLPTDHQFGITPTGIPSVNSNNTTFTPNSFAVNENWIISVPLHVHYLLASYNCAHLTQFRLYHRSSFSDCLVPSERAHKSGDTTDFCNHSVIWCGFSFDNTSASYPAHEPKSWPAAAAAA